MKRPDECSVDESLEFIGCKNVLLVLGDMNFTNIESYKVYSQGISRGPSMRNDKDDFLYSDMTMRQDIMRVFGQSKERGT